MADKIHTPLTAPAWRTALCALRHTCVETAPGDEAGCVRLLHELLGLAPMAVRLGGVQLPDSMRLERLIAADACDSAVLAMLNQGSGYIVSSSGHGGFLATVALPGQDGDTHVAGASLALALAAALIDAVLEANTAGGALSITAATHLIH